ncbi:homoserine O-acetyltransferase [Salinisphaera sp. Q1T1-3]|uniref:homoserine O-succinyltransferase MetX n=1 Tax=Salinisphaera sp. Q1T1-3 TaxID=2321229 RepID=UPI000E723217|nr:homoserine O-acetyltransferase [Salinisphaera sp. Q1T1-3]RJS94668.1 homoserine O-acetyltransferase [Salinisphaera sp. Q1T1-3]
MSDHASPHSVGLVTPETLHVAAPMALDCGKQLCEFDLDYETYGTLNADGSNAVLVCHALSGNHHAAGRHQADDAKPGWWDKCIGPGKMIDTNRFFVVASANLGAYNGSTGPGSINPETGRHYGPDFPVVTVGDWVRAQNILRAHLGIETWAAVVGGSLGGMQVMQWAIDFPDRLRHAVVIASAPKLSAQNIAFNEIARQAIVTDPEFHAGRYYEAGVVPRRGLMLARMLGHITYLSDEAMRAKFGRDLRAGRIGYGFDVEFQVESYLRYQGESFVGRFDANTYLLMTKALDYFDPAYATGGDLAAAFGPATARFMVISFTSDWRFAPARSREIVDALVQAGKEVAYAEVASDLGHDDFLLTMPHYVNTMKAYMGRVAAEVGA